MIFWLATIAITYLVIMSGLAYGYSKYEKDQGNPLSAAPEPLSVVVPFRNEVENLPKFLSQIHLMDTPQVELILVDDHSDDASLELVKTLAQGAIKVISLNTGTGKKEALRVGAQAARYKYILTTDVDCIISKNVLKNICCRLASDVKLYVLPVRVLRSYKSFITSFFDSEFLALQFATFGSLGLNKPLLANGAAMVVQREHFLESYSQRKDLHLSSGDDVFMLQYFAEVYGASAIEGLDTTCTIYTRFPEKAKQLWQQRLRWVSKTPAVKNEWFQFVAALTFVANAAWIAGLVVAGIRVEPLIVIILAVRPLIDLVILMKMEKIASIHFILSRLGMTLIYPFYLILLSIRSQFFKNNKLRERKVQPKWR